MQIKKVIKICELPKPVPYLTFFCPTEEEWSKGKCIVSGYRIKAYPKPKMWGETEYQWSFDRTTEVNALWQAKNQEVKYFIHCCQIVAQTPQGVDIPIFGEKQVVQHIHSEVDPTLIDVSCIKTSAEFIRPVSVFEVIEVIPGYPLERWIE